MLGCIAANTQINISMAESSKIPKNNLFNIRSTLSNEHLVFAETLRDWRDPLLHGPEPIPLLLCPRCTTCKCDSLKDHRSYHNYIHNPSCPNLYHQHERTKSSNTKPIITKFKRRAISHDPSIRVLNNSSSLSSSIIKSKSTEHSPLTNIIKRKKLISKIPVRISPSPTSEYSPPSSSSSFILNRSSKIPRLILTRSLPSPTITIDDLYEVDSLDEDADNEETLPKKKKNNNNQLNNMDEQTLMKKKKKKLKRSKSLSDKQQRRYQHKEGRHSKSKVTSNDLSSSSSSSSLSLSIVPLREKSRLHRLLSPSQVHSSLSDDSLSGKIESKPSHRSRPRSEFISNPSLSINPMNSFGLEKTIIDVWKSTNSNEENDYYPRYSTEYTQPIKNTDKNSIPILSRNIILQRGQIDYWQNCETLHDSMITSSCENSTGSASHLLSPSLNDIKQHKNSNGHIISITTTKRHQSSLLNKSKNTQWNIKGDGKQLRYSKIKSHSDDQLLSQIKHFTDTGSSSETNHLSIPIIHNHTNENIIPIDKNSKQIITYASTDEDVDELNSHYSDVIDRSNSLIQNSREKFNTHLLYLNDEQNENNTNSLIRSRIFSTEYSQITFDSGVDINSEQKIYQPNTTLTIDEQLSEEITDQNDPFDLSDDSLIESQINNNNLPSILINQTDQDTYFSVKNQLNNEIDPYSGYELEVISDEDDDHHHHSIKYNSNELILTSELLTSTPSSIPPQFELKLPSFSEWIDRAFTTFLTETSQNQPLSISSRCSSMHGSQSTINTSSSSQAITVLENGNLQSSEAQDDDEHSLNDMSSSSLNCEEKVDFDTYIINSNYEKINPSITNEQNEILFLNERSKSLLSSITSSIENDDQEMMNNEPIQNDDDDILKEIEYQYSSNSHDSLLQSDHPNFNTTTTSSIDDLPGINQLLSSTFYSKDSALGSSDDNLNNTQSTELIIQEEKIIFQDKIVNNNKISINTDMNTDNDNIQKSSIMDELQLNEHDQSTERTISSSSSEQLIPKEKQTGMYYKAFGSSAAIHLAEQYHCEWLQDVSTSSPEIDDNQLRIVHQYQTLGDNEDEFYFSPQILQSSYSCPNLYSNSNECSINPRSYSLTTLDAYTHLNITHETLEQIWLSLLDVGFSDKDDYELGEYKLRHIIGLSNSYSNINQILIEKSRSHNDIFSISHKNKQKSITKIKSKSFDITSLIKTSSSIITNDSTNIGLLQGADISEPFADRLISTSIHSDVESIQSLEHEQIIPIENLSSPIIKEPLDYVFQFSPQINHNDEFDFDIDDKPLNISITFDTDDIPPPILQIHDTYMELSLFRPHSLSTIPSSRASQYASSVDSDDNMFEHEERLINKENSDENYQYHISDDDHGLIGSEFSSPQSRPLSSIQSRSLSPEEIEIKSLNNNIDEYSNNLTTIIPINELIDDKKIYIIDQIEPILLLNNNSQNNFIEKINENINYSSIQQDYITIEQQSDIYFNPNELSQRLEQLDLSNKQDLIDIKPQINLPIRYQTQRIDKVSDLEIVKQGKGFKIGYIDRQGTDPRVILTKHIDAGPDIMERDPHIGLPYKGRRILNQIFSSVLYTNGYNSFEEDNKFQHSSNDIEVPIIGTNPKHFDESDMISIDIDGPSTMLNSICESIIITQGSFYIKPARKIFEPIKKDKIEVIDSWHDCTVIKGNSTPWRSPFKPLKSSQIIKQEKSTRDIALSPIIFDSEKSILPLKVDRSCQYSPPPTHDQGLQCYSESLTSYEILPGYVKGQNINSPIRTIMTLERSADSGILVDDNHRRKSNLALQVDMKSSSSDSEDISELTTQPFNVYENTNLNLSTIEIDQEIIQLNRERSHVLDLLSLNWNRSNIWVELTEAKLNYIIGETDALLHSLSFDSSLIDNETIKLKMHRYEEDMAELTRQHLAVYRERLEDSKKQLDIKIDELELKKSSIENQTNNHLLTLEQIPHLLNIKRSKSFLSTSAENLTLKSNQDTIENHPHFLDISFLTSKNSDQHNETICRPIPRYSTRNLSNMEGLSQSQQAIIDETDKLVKDSQQLHTESASQFERARESLLSSETSIRLARANIAASRYSERKTYLSNDVTLAELFKYEQSLAKEAAKTNRHVYSTTKF